MTRALALTASAVGLLIGSFLGVLVDRVPTGEGSLLGRSACRSCGTSLRPADLVPVVSWIWLRGRCRDCRSPIGLRPLVMELGTAGCFLVAALKSTDVWEFLVLAQFLGALLALSAIDLEHHRLPNKIVYNSAALSGALIIVGNLGGGSLSPTRALMGALMFGGSLLLVSVLSGGGMGLGDVKLAGLIGLVVGAVDLASVGVAAAAAILAGGIVAVGALARGADRKSALPFGPMLALGALTAVAAGPRLVQAYGDLLL